MFQFLIGAMRPNPRNSSKILSNVSIPYRCNETVASYRVYAERKKFQFLIGAMRRRKAAAITLCNHKFQFLIGAMRPDT